MYNAVITLFTTVCLIIALVECNLAEQNNGKNHGILADKAMVCMVF